MKRIKLGIKTSEAMNYKYNIFRSTIQEALPDNLETLNSLNPVMVVEESLLQKEATNVQEDLVPDRSKATRGIKTPYKLSYEPLTSSIHNFTVGIKNMDTQVVQQFNLEFNNAETLSKITVTTTDGTSTLVEDCPLFNFEILSCNLYIAEQLLTGSDVRVSCGYYIKVVNVFDDNEKIINGIDYLGPVATGLSKPVILSDSEEYPIAINTKIPVLKIKCQGSDNGVIYFYRIVSEDTVGNISEPSPLFSMMLRQSSENLKYKLEGTFDIGVKPDNEVEWTTIISKAIHGYQYALGQPGTELFSEKGAIVLPEVPKFLNTIVSVDSSHVVSDNILQITLPNVWKENDPIYNLRQTMSLRTITTDTYGNVSEISSIMNSIGVEVSIEQMILLKKEVSSEENPEAPISLEDINGIKIKEWVKVDGRYYNAALHTGFPTNLQLTNAPTCLMTTDSAFDTLIISDDTVSVNQKYNYTFYIYDAYGNYSTVTKVIDTTIIPQGDPE